MHTTKKPWSFFHSNDSGSVHFARQPGDRLVVSLLECNEEFGFSMKAEAAAELADWLRPAAAKAETRPKPYLCRTSKGRGDSLVLAESAKAAVSYYVNRLREVGSIVGRRTLTVYARGYDPSPDPGFKLAANSDGEIRFDVEIRDDGKAKVAESDKS